MPQHPINTKLDEIIQRFSAGELSYSEARKSISETVDEEVSKVPKNYKEIIILGASKQNAFYRLNRKQKRLTMMKRKMQQ